MPVYISRTGYLQKYWDYPKCIPLEHFIFPCIIHLSFPLIHFSSKKVWDTIIFSPERWIVTPDFFLSSSLCPFPKRIPTSITEFKEVLRSQLQNWFVLIWNEFNLHIQSPVVSNSYKRNWLFAILYHMLQITVLHNWRGILSGSLTFV